MLRIFVTLCFLCTCSIASADDLGTKWWQAFKKNSAKAAAAVTVTTNLKYGAAGKDRVISKGISRHYKGIFRKLKKTFKTAEFSPSSCTNVGRELAYMAGEWKQKNADVSEWMRQIPSGFCTGESITPPKVWLAKVIDGDLPHAIILFYSGDNKLINGVYHF